jgi:hypothetical protein
MGSAFADANYSFCSIPEEAYIGAPIEHPASVAIRIRTLLFCSDQATM